MVRIIKAARWLFQKRCNNSGQATVEAAYLLPILFLLILLLCQPMILLYNHMIMSNAAAEGCRLLSTRTQAGVYSDDKYEGYIKRRLAAIPPLAIFHSPMGAKSWEIHMEGDENTSVVTVRIVNKVKPLPLLGWGAEFLGLCDADGYLTQVVEISAPTQPDWVWAHGGGPAQWTSQWG